MCFLQQRYVFNLYSMEVDKNIHVIGHQTRHQRNIIIKFLDKVYYTKSIYDSIIILLN